MTSIKTLVLVVLCLVSTAVFSQQKAFKIEVKGKGAPILLFPGFTCTGAVWDNLVEELSKTNTCHIFTFAGFGGLPAIEKPWLPKIKENVNTYIKAQHLEQSTLIGHSLGGTLALWLASDGTSFNKVIVVDGLPSVGALMMPNFNKEYIKYDTPYNNQVLQMNAQDFENMANQFVAGMCLNKDKHSQIKDWMITSDRETYVYGYTDLLKLDLREDIAKIESPVLVLGATHPYGAEAVKNTYQTQYKNLKNYTITYATNAAHFIMYDQPEWFLKTIKTALQ